MQLGRALLLVLDAHAQRALETFSCLDDDIGILALEDSVLRRVPHLEFACRDLGCGDDLKILDRHEVADFQLAFAHNRQRRRLHPANPDHAARSLSEDNRRGAGKGEIVNLVGLPARDGGGVEAGIFRVWFSAPEGVPDRLRILRGKQHPHDLAAVFVMLEYFLTDELSLPVAVGGEPNSLCCTQCLTDRLELGSLVAAIGRARGVEPLGAKQDRRPALPFRNRVLWFLQIKQVAFGWKDIPIARPHGGADVFRLTGFLGDDDLISHNELD